MLMNHDEVVSFLPHRDPFLFIDEVVSAKLRDDFPTAKGSGLKDLEGSSSEATFFTNPDLDIFRGHFPGRPILPGVIQVEMMGQAASFVMTTLYEDYSHVKLEMALLGIDNAKFRRIYMNKCVSLYSNMDKKSNIKNIEFLKRIKSGEYDVNKIAYMLPTQIFPEHWKTMLDRKASNDNYLYCKQLAPITHKYTCGKCKNKNCSEYEVQIRSSDEPMSTLVECVDCGYRWQF